MSLLLKGARVYFKGAFSKLDVAVKGGRVFQISPEIAPDGFDRVADFSRYHILPGFVDVHVHLREPGFSYKETIATGTKAAARGGYTHVFTMPNLNPVPDSVERLRAQTGLIARDACVRVTPYAAITVGEQGTRLSDMAALAPLCAGFSDDGRGVQDESVMRRAMERARAAGSIICAHCEDNALIPPGGAVNLGVASRRFGVAGIPNQSEWAQIARDVRLSRETGCRYHVCHVSTAQSVDIIRRAKAEGVDVTCETAPHYLILTDEQVKNEGRFKMNPPLRSAADREALLRGVRDGVIDMIATDHAPHSAQEKSRGLDSLMGVVGLETAFCTLNHYLVRPAIISLERLTALLSDAPRARFGLPRALEEGAPADLCAMDLEEEFTIDPKSFASMGRATPFENMRASGRCVMTLVEGRAAWLDKERLPEGFNDLYAV